MWTVLIIIALVLAGLMVLGNLGLIIPAPKLKIVPKGTPTTVAPGGCLNLVCSSTAKFHEIEWLMRQLGEETWTSVRRWKKVGDGGDTFLCHCDLAGVFEVGAREQCPLVPPFRAFRTKIGSIKITVADPGIKLPCGPSAS